MHIKIVAAACHQSIRFCLPTGLLAVGLFLTGCQGTGFQLAPIMAPPTGTPAESVAAAGPTEDWTEAGQVTVTPDVQGTPEPAAAAAPTAGTPAKSDATGTPEISNTSGTTLQPVEYTGKIENLPGSGDWTGAWQVGGRLVHVTSGTTVDQQQGQVALGSFVTVEGWPRADSSVDADWIIVNAPLAAAPAAGAPTATPVPPQQVLPSHTATLLPTQTPVPNAVTTATPPHGDDKAANEDNKDNKQNSQGQENGTAVHPVEFRDVVQSMPGTGLVGIWRTGGRTVNVNARTRVQQKEGAFRPGATVQVMGWQQPDGSINAAYLMVKKNLNNKGNAGNAGNGNDEDQGDGKGNGKGNDNGNGKGNGNGK